MRFRYHKNDVSGRLGDARRVNYLQRKSSNFRWANYRFAGDSLIVAHIERLQYKVYSNIQFESECPYQNTVSLHVIVPGNPIPIRRLIITQTFHKVDEFPTHLLSSQMHGIRHRGIIDSLGGSLSRNDVE